MLVSYYLICQLNVTKILQRLFTEGDIQKMLMCEIYAHMVRLEKLMAAVLVFLETGDIH